uniref:Syntaxin 6/10/61 N-terminal domain-containing protein n=1 Tax=Rhipicephalus pulchellus TaxID=72859 RepID=L7LZ45_RHIPC
MSLEDPFFVVKDEIVKAIANNKTLFERWNQYQDPSSLPSKEDIEWTTSELRKGLRSIEWDLEDLEETVGILLSCASLCDFVNGFEICRR